ncbi:fimbrial protein [Volucribacter amazonae]|uniref:Fimbrial-type adhesion domain-containing protein n=1 Tax=Volucribacter amazonae TaxID=256731 RepID=A0A9X4P911_9PAST|nr:fimbrial protein [Volucribacter amazonae]MDG6894738.1 hypothetical protein [Volucribacter amazonae]
MLKMMITMLFFFISCCFSHTVWAVIELKYDPNSKGFTSYSSEDVRELCSNRRGRPYRGLVVIEINTTSLSLNSPYLSSYTNRLDLQARIAGQKFVIRGSQQRIAVDARRSAKLELEASLAIQQSDEYIFAGQNNAVIPSQVLSLEINCQTPEGIKLHSSKVDVQVSDIPLDSLVNTKTCVITSERNLNITMPTITVSQLTRQNEIFGRRFSISTDCGTTSSLSSAYVVFSDGIWADNHSDILKPSSDSATGVGLKIYPQGSSSPIVYYPTGRYEKVLNRQIATPFSSFQQGKGTQSFDVYYVKTGTVESGRIKSLAIYTLFYK